MEIKVLDSLTYNGIKHTYENSKDIDDMKNYNNHETSQNTEFSG